MQLGVPAKIFVPSISSPAKIARIRDYGADLVVGGDRYADALAASEAWVAQSGALPVHAFDQVETLLGQGTIGLELDEQAPELDTLLVAVGGGGLIGGIAAWYAGRVQASSASSRTARRRCMRALAAGRPVDAETGSIAADSLAPRRVGELVFPIAQRVRRARRAGLRRRDSRRASDAVECGAHRRRTRRCGRVRRAALRRVPACARANGSASS